VQVIGRGQEVLRLKKRLECAAGALGVHLAIEHLPDDIRAAELSRLLKNVVFRQPVCGTGKCRHFQWL